VVELIGRQECVLSAQQIVDELRQRNRSVAIATVYRTLEALEDVGLVQRLDVGGGAPARFEPALPGGAEHHHHLVCRRCGRVYPFDDPNLEKALDALADRLEHRVEGHDVVLSGTCRACR
jgi:Fur family transcriptional regulator, ferric uptake regulator